MSRIKGIDTKPEIIVRKYLHANGLRYRLHNKNLPGKPDITLKKYLTVIIVNGCFWHGHVGCRYFVLPKTRTEWWQEKIEKTKKRDKNSIKEIEQTRWKAITIWGCELMPVKKEQTLRKLMNFITSTEKLNYVS